MTPSHVASIAALGGGACWLLKVGLIWASGGSNTDEGAVAIAFLGGLALLAVAVGASGYALVATAPIWLRAVVSTALALLAFALWQLADDAVTSLYTADTWLRDELTIVVTAVLALLLGRWGLGRRDRAPDVATKRDRPHRGGSHLAS